MEFYDADIQDYPRIPCHLIFDEEGRKLWPIGIPIVNDERFNASWSEDNWQKSTKAGSRKAIHSKTSPGQIDVNPRELKATAEHWNELRRPGEDKDHRRPPKTMMPITNPPFYVVEAWPIVNNTQGGPEHEVKQRVLAPMKKPIPRLYVAGRSA